MAALPVLADEHCAAFAVYFQHQFSAVRAMGPCDIVMLKRLIAAFDFSDRLLCVLLHFFDKGGGFTLLSAMENPAAFMQGEEKNLVKTLGETGGLGTVATRADIIEKPPFASLGRV